MQFDEPLATEPHERTDAHIIATLPTQRHSTRGSRRAVWWVALAVFAINLVLIGIMASALPQYPMPGPILPRVHRIQHCTRDERTVRFDVTDVHQQGWTVSVDPSRVPPAVRSTQTFAHMEQGNACAAIRSLARTHGEWSGTIRDNELRIRLDAGTHRRSVRVEVHDGDHRNVFLTDRSLDLTTTVLLPTRTLLYVLDARGSLWVIDRASLTPFVPSRGWTDRIVAETGSRGLLVIVCSWVGAHLFLLLALRSRPQGKGELLRLLQLGAAALWCTTGWMLWQVFHPSG